MRLYRNNLAQAAVIYQAAHDCDIIIVFVTQLSSNIVYWIIIHPTDKIGSQAFLNVWTTSTLSLGSAGG